MGWLDPMSPEEIEAEATRQVMAQFGPLLQGLGRELRQGRRAINKSTRGAQRRARRQIGPTRHFFDELVREQAATDDALANYLSSMGAQGQAGLEAALSEIGAPQAATNAIAGGAGRSGRGAAQAYLGVGAGDVGALRQMGAAEVGLMSRMPGVHGLAGQQAIAALTKDIADQRQDIRGQIPGAISDTVSQLRNQAIDLALANRARRDDRRAAAADASAGGFDQGQMIGYRGDAISAIQSLGDSLYTERPIVIERKGGKAIYAKEGGGRTFNPNEAAVQQSALPYSEAYQRAYALVAGQLRAAGFSEPEIASTVQEALAAMGFSGGGRGGDYTSFALTPGLQSMSRVEEIRAGR